MNLFEDNSILGRVAADLEREAARRRIVLVDTSLAALDQLAAAYRAYYQVPASQVPGNLKTLQTKLCMARAEQVYGLLRDVPNGDRPASWQECNQLLARDLMGRPQTAAAAAPANPADEKDYSLNKALRRSTWHSTALREGKADDLINEVYMRLCPLVLRNAQPWLRRTEGVRSWWGFVYRALPAVIARSAEVLQLGEG